MLMEAQRRTAPTTWCIAFCINSSLRRSGNVFQPLELSRRHRRYLVVLSRLVSSKASFVLDAEVQPLFHVLAPVQMSEFELIFLIDIHHLPMSILPS